MFLHLLQHELLADCLIWLTMVSAENNSNHLLASMKQVLRIDAKH